MQNKLSKLLVAAAILPAANMFAGVFVITDDAQPASKGDLEFHVNVESSIGKANGKYVETGISSELAYGATDTLEIAGTLDFSSVYARPNSKNPLYDRASDFNCTGLSIALKNQILDPESEAAPFGLAFVGCAALSWADAAGAGIREYAFSMGLNFQKNFLDNDLVFALTPGVEFLTSRENSKEAWADGIVYSVGAGVSYHLGAGWRVGIEASYEVEYGEKFAGARFYAGPNLCYEAESWWFTLAVLPQIAANAHDLQGGVDLDGGSRVTVSAQLGFVF